MEALESDVCCVQSRGHIAAPEFHSRVVVKRLRACRRVAGAKENSEAKDLGYPPFGGCPLDEPLPDEPPPPSGEPNWKRSMVNVRIPRPAKTSARATSPKCGIRITCPSISTPGTLSKSVSIFSTSEHNKTSLPGNVSFPDFESFLTPFCKSAKVLQFMSRSCRSVTFTSNPPRRSPSK